MRLIEHFLSLFAPHDCLVCTAEGSLLCVSCATDAFEVVPERCYRCFVKSRDSAVCKSCRRHSPLRFVWVATEYDGVAKRLVVLMKYERAHAAVNPITERILDALPFIKEDTIIAHIPTATSRQRARGYDQSAEIARMVATNLGLRHMSLLERHGQSRQVGATRKQRSLQAEGMFRVAKPDMTKGANILLLDDILTTGASVESASRSLRAAGAKQVDAVVFAQKH